MGPVNKIVEEAMGRAGASVMEAQHQDFAAALAKIARGRTDAGVPLNRWVAQNIAREALVKAGRGW